jgi:integrase
MTRKISRKAKVQALAARPGTAGERQAAEAALARIGSVAPAVSTARTARLTDALARKLPAPASGQAITWDTEESGFGIRVTAGGARSYIFNYRTKGSGQQRRVTIGSVSSWGTVPARNEAKRLRRLVDSGEDPRGDHEGVRDAPTMSELIDRFETEYLPRKRPNTIHTYKGMINKHLRPFFGKFTKAADIEFADVDKLHREVTAGGSQYAANRCIALLSRIFSMAIKWKMRPDNSNPAKGVERNPESKRKRYLSGDELKRLMTALAETPDRQFTAIIGLLLLTGARRGEVFAMRWADVTLAKSKGVWSKPGSTTKQRSDHIVPLSEPACLLLNKIKRNGEFVFPSDGATGHIVEIKKGWAALLERAKIKSFRLHDLRHSFASQLVSSGASLELIGAMLGHSSPTTTARYAHLFDEVQREAAERVGAIVAKANGDRHDD